MLATFALLAVLAAHNNSEGTSRFVVDEQGRVEIGIQLLELDLPELCDVDVAGPGGRDAHDHRITTCVRRGLPSWLRLRLGTDGCAIGDVDWRRGDGIQILVEGVASCGRPAGRQLTIDWGLFAATELEHVNTATIVLPDTSRRSAMFSRRHNKVIVDVPDARGTRGLIAFSIIGLGAVITAIMLLVQRRRHRRQQRQTAG